MGREVVQTLMLRERFKIGWRVLDSDSAMARH